MMADQPLDAYGRPRVPLGRYASADEVAKLALWLASDDSAYANGAEFVARRRPDSRQAARIRVREQRQRAGYPGS